jgi:hypothetical protein
MTVGIALLILWAIRILSIYYLTQDGLLSRNGYRHGLYLLYSETYIHSWLHLAYCKVLEYSLVVIPAPLAQLDRATDLKLK